MSLITPDNADKISFLIEDDPEQVGVKPARNRDYYRISINRIFWGVSTIGD